MAVGGAGGFAEGCQHAWQMVEVFVNSWQNPTVSRIISLRESLVGTERVSGAYDIPGTFEPWTSSC